MTAPARQGRIAKRLPRCARLGFTIGFERLQVDGCAGGLLYVPAGVRPELPAPLVLLLHGEGATAQHGLELLIGQADDAGLVLLAPSSLGEIWDLVLGGYGQVSRRSIGPWPRTLSACPWILPGWLSGGL